MDYSEIEDNDNDFTSEEVKYHTRQKHKFIECYLNIWTENVDSEENRQNKRVPSLDIIDLYAASGLVTCDDAKEYHAGDYQWPGSALLAAQCLENYSFPGKLLLNSYHKNPEKCRRQYDALNTNIEKFRKIRNKIEITSQTIEPAAEWALRQINPKYPNIWILDPYAVSELPWSVVEKIGTNWGQYKSKGKNIVRKPELIITFMTPDLQRNITKNPHIISDAIGISESEWLPPYLEKINRGEKINARQYILDLYAQKLSAMYEKPPIIAEIKSTGQTNIVYCMLFLTDNNAGHYMMKLHGLKELEQWKIYQWNHDAKIITTKKNNDKIGQKDLSEWF